MRHSLHFVLTRTAMTVAGIAVVISTAAASAAPYSSRNTLSSVDAARLEQMQAQARGFDGRIPDTRAEQLLQQLQQREDVRPDEHYFATRRWLPRIH